MPPLTLEERVAVLEQKVEQLTNQDAKDGRKKDWRKTIGIFTDNPGMQELFAEAMKLREADRKKARRRTQKKKQRARS